uniref:Uncharacterized protein n=1 Tax=Anguilla anguilla TaxID=7936 RepID=A0A0E9S4G5_ANGAN
MSLIFLNPFEMTECKLSLRHSYNLVYLFGITYSGSRYGKIEAIPWFI